MLPDEQDVLEFLMVLTKHVGAAPDEQLAAVQSWALTTIGRAAFAAADWLTILRVLKEQIGLGLTKAFPAEVALSYIQEPDHILTNALIEAAQLTTYMGQAELLEHTVTLREELERLEQSKSNFVNVAAHELRTPLTIVEGYANMLRAETDSGSPLQLYLSGMENGLVRMKELIGDMIEVSLIDLQSFELSYQKVSLETIASIVADNLEKYFAKRGVELQVEPFEMDGQTYADPQRLVTALEKILYNGLKYTPDGGQVTVRGTVLRDEESSGEVAGYAAIHVTDTGIGIDPENLDRIFDKFGGLADVRLHSSSKTAFKGGGAGLGLPIARGIIEAHGGRIFAQSAGFDESACPGSTFTIELPLYTTAPPVLYASLERDAA
jgi:signal transduction histidine kinase